MALLKAETAGAGTPGEPEAGAGPLRGHRPDRGQASLREAPEVGPGRSSRSRPWCRGQLPLGMGPSSQGRAGIAFGCGGVCRARGQLRMSASAGDRDRDQDWDQDWERDRERGRARERERRRGRNRDMESRDRWPSVRSPRSSTCPCDPPPPHSPSGLLRHIRSRRLSLPRVSPAGPRPSSGGESQGERAQTQGLPAGFGRQIRGAPRFPLVLGGPSSLRVGGAFLSREAELSAT